jgi:hypothetical protein
MQPSEALGIAAQVAVTLAGFAGIVVVFRPESVHRWSPLDKLRLELLLTNSALPLAEALFGMLVLTFDSPPEHLALVQRLWFLLATLRFCLFGHALASTHSR